MTLPLPPRSPVRRRHAAVAFFTWSGRRFFCRPTGSHFPLPANFALSASHSLARLLSAVAEGKPPRRRIASPPAEPHRQRVRPEPLRLPVRLALLLRARRARNCISPPHAGTLAEAIAAGESFPPVSPGPIPSVLSFLTTPRSFVTTSYLLCAAPSPAHRQPVAAVRPSPTSSFTGE